MQNKKIGIITFHKNIASYGASLQAYATFMYLKGQGYDPIIIDLRSHESLHYKRSKHHLTISKSRRWSCIKGRLYYYFLNPLKILRFRSFNNMLRYTHPYFSVDQLFNNPPSFDVYCTGSDQTLNPRLTIAPDAFLLGFTDGKKISYASSIGEVELKAEYKPFYKELIPKYNHISVRENHTQMIISEFYDKDKLTITLDPTMLLPKDHYESLSVRPHFNEEYLLFFSLHPNKTNLRFAERVAKKNGLKLISIGRCIKGADAHFITAAGPREWLGLIKSASHIITDSFHGTVFSLLLNDNFISLVPQQGDNRIGQLLKLFNLDSHIRYIDDNDIYSIEDTSFDKEKFLKDLEIESKKSKDWFLNAIEN